MSEISTKLEAAWLRVKQLDWVGTEGGPGADIEATPDPHHRYLIRHLASQRFDIVFTFGEHDWTQATTVMRTYDEAKTAAQADYTSRILAALEAAP